MIKLFVDTNILVELIADRKPFSKSSVQLFHLAERKKIKLYTSSHSIATSYYILKKYMDEKKLRQVILGLLDYVEAVGINETVLKKSLRSKFKDFEDALQAYTAGSINNLDFIVTRNLKDFKASDVPAISPDDFLLKM